jgi:light-regulated signal transduction histidine kinase (bacteriophytochrome)
MAHDETLFALLHELGPRSLLVVPLVARERPLGVLSFSYSTSDRRYSNADLPLNEDLARRAAVAIDNARLYREAQTATDTVRAMNAQLEQRVSERATELKAFAYSAAHNRPAPLRGINGFSVALSKDYASLLDATGLEYLQQIRTGSQKMGQLIDDLLALSRVTRREMQRSWVDLSGQVTSIVEDLRIRDADRVVVATTAPGVGTVGNPALVQIALQNLVDNAWKFTSKRAVGEIEFGVAVGEGRRVYFLRDNGAGFDMAYVGRLFGVFQRLH